jgi:lysophospholipase L1-like esterase
MNSQSSAFPLRWIVLLAALLCAVSACSPSSSHQPASSSRSSVPQVAKKYVALGDSYASAPLVPVTDVANGCFRSSNNYASLVARKLKADLEDRSCGAAVIADLSRSQYPDVPAQLTALKADTNLVTIGIGGNDQDVFAQLTNRCPKLSASDPKGAPCEEALSRGGKDVLLTAIAKTRTRLTTAVTEIQERAPQAQVLVVGYPQIVSADHICAKLPLARGDYAYGEKVSRALNDALRAAAEATGSTYVDVYAASKGHDVCAADPWVNGSVTDQKRAAAYHPFAAEQKAVADLVLAAVRR